MDITNYVDLKFCEDTVAMIRRDHRRHPRLVNKVVKGRLAYKVVEDSTPITDKSAKIVGWKPPLR